MNDVEQPGEAQEGEGQEGQVPQIGSSEEQVPSVTTTPDISHMVSEEPASSTVSMYSRREPSGINSEEEERSRRESLSVSAVARNTPRRGDQAASEAERVFLSARLREFRALQGILLPSLRQPSSQ